jgi:hypothetical protein
MSQEVGQTELKAKTQQLLDGPLKHIRAAAIAAALLPLASVAATPASAQNVCNSGGVCGTVYTDTNNNGIQDLGEPPISLATVILVDSAGTVVGGPIETNLDGTYAFGPLPPGTYTVGVVVPTGLQVNKSGVVDGAGYSVVTTTLATANLFSIDLGFVTSAAPNPGTGTPGYWKNHPEAWPAGATPIVISANPNISYTKDQAIAWLGKVGKDKTTTIFASYVSAYLNTFIGNDASCVSAAQAAAKTWLAAHPVGSNVAASSTAWQQIEWAHQTMDAYNNGQLCAPHRQ